MVRDLDSKAERLSISLERVNILPIERAQVDEWAAHESGPQFNWRKLGKAKV